MDFEANKQEQEEEIDLLEISLARENLQVHTFASALEKVQVCLKADNKYNIKLWSMFVKKHVYGKKVLDDFVDLLKQDKENKLDSLTMKTMARVLKIGYRKAFDGTMLWYEEQL